MLVGGLIASSTALAEDDFELPPEPVRAAPGKKAVQAVVEPYAGLDEAVDVFVTDWFAAGQTGYPARGVEVFREVAGPTFKLSVVRGAQSSFRPQFQMNKSPKRHWGMGGWGGRKDWREDDWGRSFRRPGTGSSQWRGESSVVMNPETGNMERRQNFSTSSRQEFVAPDGFAREQTYSRSYSRSTGQSLPNHDFEEEEKMGPPNPREQAAKAEIVPEIEFETTPIGRVFFYGSEKDWKSVVSQLQTQRRLLHAGAVEDGIHFYVLIK